MVFKPLKYHPYRSSRHLAFYNSILYVYDGFVVTIPCMEVRRLMIGEVHPNVDSIEETNLRHTYSVICSDGKDTHFFSNIE